MIFPLDIANTLGYNYEHESHQGESRSGEVSELRQGLGSAPTAAVAVFSVLEDRRGAPMNTRAGCWQIPSERIAFLLWAKTANPTGWRAWWATVAQAWRRTR